MEGVKPMHVWRNLCSEGVTPMHVLRKYKNAMVENADVDGVREAGVY
jgi:hypothetical protein